MKKGFTLVELLGTIILIGLLSFVVAVPIIARINKNNDKINKATLKILKESVLQYIETYNNDFRSKKVGTTYYITLDELDYIDSDIETLYNNKALDEYTQIKIEIDSDLDYEISLVDSPLTNIKAKNTGEYVLFNGILWKIINKNTNNKTVRLISEEFVGSVQKGTETTYSETYVYEWLNNYFMSMLNYTNVIKKSLYGDKESYVGLPTKDEAQINEKSGYTYFVLNGNNIENNDSSSNNSSLIRPVIEVFDGTIITKGSGSQSDPYILRENKNDQTDSSLKEADITIGQYISFKGNTYRIIEYGYKKLKLISTFSEGQGIYANNGQSFNLDNGSGNILNNSNTENYMNLNNVYVGNPYLENANYENTTLKKTNPVYRVYKSLPVVGELFTVPIDNNNYWTLNVLNTTKAYQVGPTGLSAVNYSTQNKLLYTIYISADSTIKSGTGTQSDPYVVQELIFGGRYIAPLSGETHKGIVYMDPTNLKAMCTPEIEATNLTIAGNGSSTKTGVKTGCMKFYIYDDSGDNYKMILDHNTTPHIAWITKEDYLSAGGTEASWGDSPYSVISRVDKGPVTALKQLHQDTENWVVAARLIDFSELSTITQTEFGNYIGSGDSTAYSSQTEEQKARQRSFHWLFDYLYGCRSYGCVKEGTGTWLDSGYDLGSYAYWTNSSCNLEFGIVMDYNGQFSGYEVKASVRLGIRPVIELPKNAIDIN